MHAARKGRAPCHRNCDNNRRKLLTINGVCGGNANLEAALPSYAVLRLVERVPTYAAVAVA